MPAYEGLHDALKKFRIKKRCAWQAKDLWFESAGCFRTAKKKIFFEMQPFAKALT